MNNSWKRRVARRGARRNQFEQLEPRQLLAAAVAGATPSLGADGEVPGMYLPPQYSQWNPDGYLTKTSNASPLDIAIN